MCPKCAVERLRAGAVDEPIGDALIEAFDTIEKQARASDATAEKLAGLLCEVIKTSRDVIEARYHPQYDLTEKLDLMEVALINIRNDVTINVAISTYDAERKSIASDQRADKETSHGK